MILPCLPNSAVESRDTCLTTKIARPVVVVVVALVTMITWTAPVCAQVGSDAAGVAKAMPNNIIIRGQLELGALYARQALERLRTSPSGETPETLRPIIHASYTQLSAAISGIGLKRQAAKMRRFDNPLDDLAWQELEKALTHIRNAFQAAEYLSSDRPDLMQRVITHLEAVLSIVPEVEDLL